eukprot:jgi/Chrzof1/1584/Cz10g13120.t1
MSTPLARPLQLSQQPNIQFARLASKAAMKHRLRHVAVSGSRSHKQAHNGHSNEGLGLSLFHPFKRLPAEGRTVPLEEELCDIEVQNCKTPLHVYEMKCSHCAGSGWAKGSANGRRGSLHTCLVCKGLGYVRRTSAAPPDNDDHLIINRPLLWNGKFEAKLDPDQQNGRTASKQKSGNGVAADARMGNGKQ